MNFEFVYELVAAAFLVLVAVSFSLKNWIALRANRVFFVIVNTSVWFTLTDILVRAICTLDMTNIITYKYILSQIAALEMVATFAMFYVYFMALTEHLRGYHSRFFLLSMFPAIVLGVLVIMTPWTHFIFYYDAAGLYHKGAGHFIVVIVTYGYALAMCVLAYKSPAYIKRKDVICCFLLSAAHLGAVILQHTVLKNYYLLSFYFSDFMVVVFYLRFQNMDRFLDRISGGFSRAGFRRVVQEKYRYRERFGSLFVTIQNYQTISNLCNEQELCEVMGKIGSILRFCGGRHNQFHIHGADFAVIRKTEKELVEVYEKVSGQLPTMLRINNRNININYGFFILTLEEAGYEESEFYKMMSSMKKQLNSQTDTRKLLRYEGEVQKEVNLELYVGHELKNILRQQRCELRFSPIMDATTGKCHALESSLYLLRENGRAISEDVIWSVARDMGYMKDLGRVVMESTMECVTREQILIKGVNKVAINVAPLHIGSAASVRHYQEIAKRYYFPLDRFCMELTEDMTVSYDEVKEHLQELKEAGVSLILDRYGENVCNLQGIMAMPFGSVKISGQMVQRYCQGESDILEYQIRMLRENGWDICLEGIDNELQYEKVKDLGADYLQGLYFSHPLAADQLRFIADGNL